MPSLLSRLIKSERKKFCRVPQKPFSKLYYPSFKSFFVILIIVVFFSLLAYLKQILYCFGCQDIDFFLFKSLSVDSNYYQNLIAIHAGIGAIIFALVIFIAESLRDDEAKDKARVLLRESYLFPLAVAEILIFFIFIWGDVTLLSIIPVILMGLFTILSLSRMISVLLSRYRFAQKRAQLLREQIDKSIDLAIDERIGNNILFSKLDGKEIKLKFYPFSIDNEQNYYCFYSEKIGIVSDINLKKLEEIARIIDEEARGKGFSFSEEKDIEVEIDGGNEVQISKTRDMKINNNRYLLKKFHDSVDKERNILICIDKNLIKDNQKIDELESLVASAFVIKPTNNFDEEIRREISGVKDQFITCILNKHIGKVDELIELYVNLADGFLEHMAKCGGVYSAQQARIERQSLFLGWEQVKWLSTDIRELYEEAMKSKDRNIMGKVGYLPFQIARRSIEMHDHYLFQEFIWFAELLYEYAVKESETDIKYFLVDRTWRWPKEICLYDIEPKLLKGSANREELINLKDYAIHFFMIFQNLLKKSFDKKDLGSFELFLKAAQAIFSRLKPMYSPINADTIESELDHYSLTSRERPELEGASEDQSFKENIQKEIELKRNQMFFGLASWLLDQYLQNQTNDILKQFYQSINNVSPSTIEELTEVFLSAHNFEVEDFWGWSWWEMKWEGEVQSIQILEKLEKFYAIKALSLLADKTEKDISNIRLPHNRDLAFLAEGAGELIHFLDNIKSNQENWKFVLTDNAINKIDSLKDLLLRAKEAQEMEEREIKRKQRISSNKVEEFKKGVIKGFYESIIIRDIFRYYGLLKNNKLTPKEYGDVPQFGFSVIEDKAVFLENWFEHFNGWGEIYGQNLANSENLFLFRELSKNCKEISEDKFDDAFLKIKNYKDIILISTNISFSLVVDYSSKFIPKWKEDTNKQLQVNGFIGWYDFGGKLIPVFEIYHKDIEKQILIINKNKIGQIIQFSPLNIGEDRNLIEDIFYINIQAFSEKCELIEKFIKEPPDWLKAIGEEKKQREYLEDRVLIKIFEKFKYDIHRDFEGYKLLIK